MFLKFLILSSCLALAVSASPLYTNLFLKPSEDDFALKNYETLLELVRNSKSFI